MASQVMHGIAIAFETPMGKQDTMFVKECAETPVIMATFNGEDMGKQDASALDWTWVENERKKGLLAAGRWCLTEPLALVRVG